MNWVDFSIFIIILISAMIGFSKGFIKEILSIFSWLIILFVIKNFYVELSDYLFLFNESVPFTETDISRKIFSVTILFVIAYILCNVSISIFSKFLKKIGLSGTDKFLGFIFGAGRGILFVALVLFVIERFTSLVRHELWLNSALIKYFGFIIKFIVQFFNNSSFIM